MISAKAPARARILSVIAATVVALACGTNYVYSAWGPQFAQRLKLSSTQSNLIGTFGNLGMYATGVPFGMIVDAKGPRWGVALSAVLFAAGYYPLAKAFDAGPGAFSVVTLCTFSFFTGAGSSSAFGASIKAAALNFPEARGTATAFPVAAFGLSAFFFATIALALPHDTPHFLLLLATGTVALPLISFPFLRTPPEQKYKTVPQYELSALHRTSSSPGRPRLFLPDTGAQESNTQQDSSIPVERPSVEHLDSDDGDEASSLFSTTSSQATAELSSSKPVETDEKIEALDLDIRGFALIRHVEFWQLFLTLLLLAGIGLMTINNIGNDAQALWQRFDPNASGAFIAKRQVAYVSTLSVCSFTGRLLSGIGSDILVNKYDRSRFWCLFASASLFAIAQLTAEFIEYPDLLLLVAGVTGIAYGMLFGVYPSLVSHAFGVHGLSQNWGTMTLAPMISGNVFNLMYGAIFDSYSIVEENGDRSCPEGRECYSKAYLITWFFSLVGLLICAWSIHYENQVHLKKPSHQRVA